MIKIPNLWRRKPGCKVLIKNGVGKDAEPGLSEHPAGLRHCTEVDVASSRISNPARTHTHTLPLSLLTRPSYPST
ncbi:hypothetical protein BDY24DRAFT_417006 [Mrakia frigida]|uniref:uncharacterized protein n=1 Tax=Mrakia frigida TaxID=29902 RepID=UPI003FCC046D